MKKDKYPFCTDGRDYDDIDAKKMCAKVTDALVARDAKALKSRFSKRALSEVQDFDAEANAVLTLFQGEIESQELNTGTGSSESKDETGYKKELKALVDVNTDRSMYRFNMVYATLDTANPQDVGLYSPPPCR